MPSKNKKSEIWTTSKELELIDFMEPKKYMWDPKHPKFYKAEQKGIVFEECACSLGYGFTAPMVKDRWTNLRTTFSSNYKKVLHSSGSGSDVFKPTWDLYERLKFLSTVQKQWQTFQSIMPQKFECSSYGDDQEDQATQCVEVEVVESFSDFEKSQPSGSSAAGLMSLEDHSINFKKTRSNPKRAFEEAFNTVKKTDNSVKAVSEEFNTSDTHDHFCVHVAGSLREMDSFSAQLAKLEIQKVLIKFHNDNPNKPTE